MKEKFARWDILFLLYIKRDWKKLLTWVFGLSLFSAGFVPAFEEIAKGQGLQAMFETLQNPAMLAMIGPTPVENANEFTLGAMYAHEMLLFCGLFAMIIAALHVIGHTRKEENLGLTELIRSFQVGRQATSFAVMAEIVLIHFLLALFISIIMVSFGAETITVEGSVLFGISIGIAGLIGAGIALVMAQIMPVSSAATGSTLGIIGILYIVRAGTDVSNVDLSMINPMGWTYLTFPFSQNNWLPLFWAIIFIIVIVIIAFSLEGARDMGAGYLPEKEGRAYAKKTLLSVRGLFLQINKGVIISWFITFIIMGAAYGSIYGDMQSFLESNELMKQMFSQSGVTMEESFTGTIMMVMIALVSILPIAIVNKLFAVENRSLLSQLYATKITRAQLYWTNICLAVLVGIIGILFAAGGLGGTAISVMGENHSMAFMDFLLAGYNFTPAVLFFTGLAALALGFAPKTGKVVYIYLTYSFLLNYFGNILDLPEWFYYSAIQSWIPQMPTEEFDGLVFTIILFLSFLLMWLGYIGYKKRDMQEAA